MAIKWKIEQIEALFKRQAESGLSQKRFCLENDLKYGTFLFWKKKRLKRPGSNGHFIRLTPSAGVADTKAELTGPRYRIQMGYRVLDIPFGFNGGEVRALIELLGC